MDNVTPLRPETNLSSPRRQEFLDYVASTFDAYAKERGFEPDGISFQLGGAGQPVELRWNVSGNLTHAFLCKAAMAMMARLSQ